MTNNRVAIGDSQNFLVYGGDPTGRCRVHKTITAWPGWKRIPFHGRRHGGQPATSLFSGPQNAMSAFCMARTTLPLTWENGARELAERLASRVEAARQALDGQKTGSFTPRGPRKPMPHQQQAVSALRNLNGRAILADDMGLGKTSTALWAAEMIAEHILVICPASVKFNWEREVAMTLGLEALVIHGPAKKRASQLAELDHYRVCVINYDLLLPLSDQQLNKLHVWTLGQALICDESHYLKNRKAARTDLVTKFFAGKRGAKCRLLLSGTPIRNTVADIYSQIEIVSPGTWVNYWDFEKRHLVITTMEVAGGRKIQTVCGSKNLKELQTVTNTIQIRRVKEEVLDLPEKIHTYPELELDESTGRVYRAMRDWALLKLSELDDSEHVFSPKARSSVEAALRCEQIASGFVGGVPEPLMETLSKILARKAEKIPGRPRELIFPKSAKLVWLQETLTTLLKTGKRPVVYSRFNAPLFWLTEQWDGAYMLHGGLDAKTRQKVVEDFHDGAGKILFCQVKIAEGMNFTFSQDEIFLGRDWSPAINAQAEDRCHRIGTKGTVNIQIPVMRDTIEDRIHKVLLKKARDASDTLAIMTIGELKEAL